MNKGLEREGKGRDILDDVGEDLNTEVLHTNDEGRSSNT